MATETEETDSNAAVEHNENDAESDEKLFHVERAKSGRAKCKKCKNNIDSGTVRLAKLITNPFGTGKMKTWYHLPCLFDAFKKQRATTPKIEKIDDMAGYETMSAEDIEQLLQYLPDEARSHWKNLRQKLLNDPVFSTRVDSKKQINSAVLSGPQNTDSYSNSTHKDNSLRQFRKICMSLAEEPKYLRKTLLLKEFFKKGFDGSSFKGDLLLWCRLLLPGDNRIVYNLQSKQLVKIFSRIFQVDADEMLEHLEDGDVSSTISDFFRKSNAIRPAPKSTLSLKQVDEYLKQLSLLTKEENQQTLLKKVCERCTANDLQVFIRLIKHDLRINAGPKHILAALHADAYKAYKTSKDIESVINRINDKSTGINEGALDATVRLLTPVQPMLAEAGKSLDDVINKYPCGLYAEIKFDGERVQLHKQGADFKYFSRSLKPVLPHKVDHFKDYIKRAFPHGDDLILDCELLMIDMSTGDPLPFGTLGIHKRNEFKDANPCLMVFDCLYFNGMSLLNRPFEDRRRVLQKEMTEIRHHIQFSETKMIKKREDLETLLMDVLDKNLEGLVLKDPSGVYEPGKRRWIKLKRDYLFEGKAADSVDLLVLGAWYGTGHKGGMMNVFLMGCYNPEDETWRSVTKVHGHDDETLAALQTDLDMIKISKDATKIPKWLKVTKTLVPDFVARDFKNMPVWEICGHEFTKHDVHTAGISIRFPRVARVRKDKNWQTATTLAELQHLYEMSKTNASSRILPFLNPNSSDSSRNSKTNSSRESSVSPMKRKGDKCEITECEKILRKDKVTPVKPLPDLLAGKRIKVSNTAADKEFRRHFIAYGADVVYDDSQKPTHKIVPGSFSVDKINGKRMLKIQLKNIS